MSDIEAVLAAMDAAEQEAREHEFMSIATNSDALVIDMMRDRLRLIARDRATLGRHTPDRCAFCNARAIHGSPSRCPDLRAVVDYWTLS